MRRARCAVRAFALALVLVAGTWVGGCGSAADERELMGLSEANAWLESARRAHVGADAEEQAGRRREAIAALERALAVPVPAEVEAEHRRVVQQDLLFRIASLELRDARSAESLAAADRGLGLGRAGDVFTANLWIARGRALEVLRRDTEAAAAYYEALEINRALLREALGRTDAGLGD